MIPRLLESVAALALAGLFVRLGQNGVFRTAKLLTAATRETSALSAARNLLEWQRVVPCATRPACPPGMRCRIRRRLLGQRSDGESVFRVRVGVFSSPSDRKPSISLATLTLRSRRNCGSRG